MADRTGMITEDMVRIDWNSEEFKSWEVYYDDQHLVNLILMNILLLSEDMN